MPKSAPQTRREGCLRCRRRRRHRRRCCWPVTSCAPAFDWLRWRSQKSAITTSAATLDGASIEVVVVGFSGVCGAKVVQLNARMLFSGETVKDPRRRRRRRRPGKKAKKEKEKERSFWLDSKPRSAQVWRWRTSKVYFVFHGYSAAAAAAVDFLVLLASEEVETLEQEVETSKRRAKPPFT